MALNDHPLRYALANELHTRPFPVVSTPARAVYLALAWPARPTAADRDAARAHLIALLDRFGADHPPPGATHFFGALGKHRLKWESHTEFVSFTVFSDGLSERPFDGHAFEVFPADWLDAAPMPRLTSALIRVEEQLDDAEITARLGEWYVDESLAVSRVLDGELVLSGDFRIDANGHLRFAIFTRAGVGARRIGRVVQRLCEIETYKTLAMLGFITAREAGPEMAALDAELGTLIGDMGRGDAPETALERLLGLSGSVEALISKTAFRFGATGAYEALLDQRIKVLREARFGGHQTFAEFMMRRFDPAMRTAKSAERQLNAMALRAERAGDLLRTQVDVARSAQNQALLQSMDARARTALLLQQTVEGLSVVAISYYGVNLLAYLAYPVTEHLGLSKGLSMAILTPVVLIAVWLSIRRIRKMVGH